MEEHHVCVSVIVPVYNTENYLQECIDSIMEQSFPNMEIILVDDGSTDNSSEICDIYNKRYACIKVVHKENGGLSSARNAGLEKATGDWIGFVDSDDKLIPNIYNSLISLNKVDADIITMGRELLFDDGHTKSLYCHLEPEIIDKFGFLKYILEYRKLDMSVCDKLFRKEVFEEVRFPEGALCEDMLVIPDIVEHTKKVLITGIPGYVYRQRSNSITKQFDVRYLESFRSLRRLKEYVETVQPELNNDYVIFEDIFLCHIYSLYADSTMKNDEVGAWFKKELSRRIGRIVKRKKYVGHFKFQAILLYLGCGRIFNSGKRIIRKVFKI